MSWWNIETYLSIRELVLSDPAFLFSYVIYLRIWEIFWINQRRNFRFYQVYLLLMVSFLYCLLFQVLDIRWYLNHFQNNIPYLDDLLWRLMEVFNQTIHFVFLTVIRGVIVTHIPYTDFDERSDEDV